MYLFYWNMPYFWNNCSGIWSVANLLGAAVFEKWSFISTRDITHLPFQTLCIVLRLRLKLILNLLRLAVFREGKLVCVTRFRRVSLGRQYVTSTLHPSYTHSCSHTTWVLVLMNSRRRYKTYQRHFVRLLTSSQRVSCAL